MSASLSAIRWLLVSAALAGPFLCNAEAHAQPRPMPQFRESVRVKGKVTELTPGAVGIVTEDGEEWALRIDPKAREVAIQGSAEVAFLTPGMAVEFRGIFDKRGTTQQPIQQLRLFSPKDDTRWGVQPVTATSIGSLSKREDEDKPQKPPTTAPFDVTGVIQSIDKNGPITVAAGNAMIRVELSDKVQIAFNLKELRLTRPGDTVEASGWTYPMRDKIVLATRLVITAAKPLGMPTDEKKKGDGQMPDLDSLDGF